jgi:methionyl aminopeptidase
MDEIVHENYVEAGKIAAKVRKESISRIKVDVPLLEVAEYVEDRIKELGGNIAFPCNISINEIASHYTPEDNVARFCMGDVVKIDIGVHIEGFIADTASTIEIGTNNHSLLIKATEEALDRAICFIKDNVQTRMVGKIIEETIKKYGFSTLRDLTGHSLEKYTLHSGVTIPNYRAFFSNRIKKDMVFAIEPFATYGKGDIKYGKTHIFSVRPGTYESLKEKFGFLPFAKRWIPGLIAENLKELREYPELIEASRKIVAQTEHTVIVRERGYEIITL